MTHMTHPTQSLPLGDLVRATARALLPAATSPHGFSPRRLAQRSAVAFGIYVVGAGLTYCTQVWIARVVGAEGYGIYAYVVAWMTVLAYLAALGFDVSLLRFLPAYTAQQTPGLVRGAIRFAERMVTAVGFSVTLGGGIAILLWGHQLRGELANTFLVGFALLPIWALLWVRCSIVRAFGGVASALVPDRIVRDGLLLCVLVVACLGFGWRPTACSRMGAALICSLVAFGLASAAASRWQPRELAGAAPLYQSKLWLQTVAPLVVIATIEPLMNRTGVFLLGGAGEVRAAGIYAAAFNVAFLVVLPRTAINALFAPVAADLFARNGGPTATRSPAPNGSVGLPQRAADGVRSVDPNGHRPRAERTAVFPQSMHRV